MKDISFLMTNSFINLECKFILTLTLSCVEQSIFVMIKTQRFGGRSESSVWEEVIEGFVWLTLLTVKGQ